MSRAHDISDEAARIDRVFREKARSEIDAAERAGGECAAVRFHGDELAEVLLVKGEPGEADIEAGHALAGSDGDAADKALDALGLPTPRAAFCTRIPGMNSDDQAARIRMLVEAVDPATVVALDAVAADDLARALDIEPLEAGAPRAWRGRTLLAIDGLEASLTDEGLKRRVWQQLKALARADTSQT